MSLYNKVGPTTDRTPSYGGKVTTLNPNAVEFVPFALRSSPGSTSAADASSRPANASNALLGKTVVDRSESSVSNNSDDEAHQYWHCQLPEDITPDFNAMDKDDTLGINSLPFSNLSFMDVDKLSRIPASATSRLILKDQDDIFYSQTNGGSLSEKKGFSVAQYGDRPSSAGYNTKSRDRQIVNNDHPFAKDDIPYNGDSGHEFLMDMLNEQQEQHMLERTDVNPIEFLASQFPGFAVESLAEVYFGNSGDLNLTMEILNQLELQVDGGLNQKHNSKALSSTNLSASDFPARSIADTHDGTPKFSRDEMQQNGSPYRVSEKENLFFFKSRSSIPSRGSIDFAAAVRKMASQDSDMWKYNRNGSPDASVGSSRSSHVLASSYNGGQLRVGRNSVRAAPVWVETGDSVGNMYSETREDAHDHARIRNAYFEQARQAYLIGNKGLAKELSVKGQLHNMQMKEAHAKAQESIYRQRNPLGAAGALGNWRGEERLIDLHGLHVSEAIHVLRCDLQMLRSAARSTGQRLQVYICVGTGHHTRGSRTPARLPMAVQRYLLVEEGLDFSEPQPGLLRVVIY